MPRPTYNRASSYVTYYTTKDYNLWIRPVHSSAIRRGVYWHIVTGASEELVSLLFSLQI